MARLCIFWSRAARESSTAKAEYNIMIARYIALRTRQRKLTYLTVDESFWWGIFQL